MAQFYAHKILANNATRFSFMVVVQSSLYDGYSRRVVVPLVRRSTLARTAGFLDILLNPVFTVKGIKVVLHPLEMVSVALENLGEKVATLVEEGDAIVVAMDEMLTRAWG